MEALRVKIRLGMIHDDVRENCPIFKTALSIYVQNQNSSTPLPWTSNLKRIPPFSLVSE